MRNELRHELLGRDSNLAVSQLPPTEQQAGRIVVNIQASIILEGLQQNQPHFRKMGMYKLVEGKVVGGCEVWEHVGSCGCFMFYFIGPPPEPNTNKPNTCTNRWMISHRSEMEKGGSMGFLTAVSDKRNPCQIVGEWRVLKGDGGNKHSVDPTTGGGKPPSSKWQAAPTVKARAATAEELAQQEVEEKEKHETEEKSKQEAEEEAEECRQRIAIFSVKAQGGIRGFGRMFQILSLPVVLFSNFAAIHGDLLQDGHGDNGVPRMIVCWVEFVIFCYFISIAFLMPLVCEEYSRTKSSGGEYKVTNQGREYIKDDRHARVRTMRSFGQARTCIQALHMAASFSLLSFGLHLFKPAEFVHHVQDFFTGEAGSTNRLAYNSSVRILSTLCSRSCSFRTRNKVYVLKTQWATNFVMGVLFLFIGLPETIVALTRPLLAGASAFFKIQSMNDLFASDTHWTLYEWLRIYGFLNQLASINHASDESSNTLWRFNFARFNDKMGVAATALAKNRLAWALVEHNGFYWGLCLYCTLSASDLHTLLQRPLANDRVYGVNTANDAQTKDAMKVVAAKLTAAGWQQHEITSEIKLHLMQQHEKGWWAGAGTQVDGATMKRALSKVEARR
jgi:hypothetical protein